jgi:hypothetical protein
MASERDPNDHFDNKPIDFKKQLHKSYDEILTHDDSYFTKLSKRIIPVDATESPAVIALRIYLEIKRTACISD